MLCQRLVSGCGWLGRASLGVSPTLPLCYSLLRVFTWYWLRLSGPSLVCDCSGGGHQRRVTLSGSSWWIAIERFGNHWSSVRWYFTLLFWSQLGFCPECLLFHCGNWRCVAMEKCEGGIGGSVGEFRRVVCQCHSVRSVCTGNSSGGRTKPSLCFFYLCYPCSDARCRFEEPSPATL